MINGIMFVLMNLKIASDVKLKLLNKYHTVQSRMFNMKFTLKNDPFHQVQSS